MRFFDKKEIPQRPGAKPKPQGVARTLPEHEVRVFVDNEGVVVGVTYGTKFLPFTQHRADNDSVLEQAYTEMYRNKKRPVIKSIVMQ